MTEKKFESFGMYSFLEYITEMKNILENGVIEKAKKIAEKSKFYGSTTHLVNADQFLILKDIASILEKDKSIQTHSTGNLIKPDWIKPENICVNCKPKLEYIEIPTNLSERAGAYYFANPPSFSEVNFKLVIETYKKSLLREFQSSYNKALKFFNESSKKEMESFYRLIQLVLGYKDLSANFSAKTTNSPNLPTIIEESTYSIHLCKACEEKDAIEKIIDDKLKSIAEGFSRYHLGKKDYEATITFAKETIWPLSKIEFGQKSKLKNL
jgi:hypothetical protein